MEIIFKYGWILLIAVTTANGFYFRARSKKYIVENPALKEGYDKIIKGWFLYANIPWLIMAIGDLTGITDGIWAYFNPKSMNPMVLIFHLSVVVLWILGSNWIYLKGGAEFLASHPGIISFSGFGNKKDISSPAGIKLFWAIALISGIAGMIMMWIWDFNTM